MAKSPTFWSIVAGLLLGFFASKGVAGMDGDTDRANNDVYHERANHEDILHTRRLGLFLTFNSFLAVAVGLTYEHFIIILFAFIGFGVSLFWILWARNAGIFIRALRDAGGSRVDQELWTRVIRPMDNKYKSIIAPLNIMNYWFPTLLILGWIAVIVYYFLH